MACIRNEIGNNSPSEITDVFSENAREKNISRIKTALTTNFYGCDLILCLFYSSLNSFRVEQYLRPLPLVFRNNETDSVDKLRQICSSLPSLKSLTTYPKCLSAQAVSLLNHLLISQNQPVLKLLNFDNFQMPHGIDITSKPNYIFQVIYSRHITDTWNNLKKNHNVIMAFHGSCLEKFYSIIRFGLQQHFGNEKVQLFGPGIYLSTELSVSMIFAPFSTNWPGSVLGTKLSIVAVCEILNIEDKIKRKASNNVNKSATHSDFGGEIPDKYLVVTDSEVIKIKYLLVYSRHEAKLRFWTYRNILSVLFVLYFLFLCIIGSQNSLSVTFTKLWNRYLKKYFL